MSIKRNVVYNTILSTSQLLIPLITFPYTSRVLGPHGTGGVGFADSLTSYFVVFAALGIPYYGIREVAKIRYDKKKLNTLFSELLILHIIASLLLVFFYVIIIFTVNRLSVNKPLFFLGCGILMMNPFPVEWLFQGLEEFKFITLRTLVIRILIIILLFIVIKSPKDSFLLYFLNFTAVFLNAAINFYYSRKFVKLSFVGLNFYRHLKPLFNMLASNLAINVYILMDSILLGFMSNDTAVGYYTSSSRINKMVLNCVASFGVVLIPQISSAFNSNNKTRVKELVEKSLNYVFLVGIPIGVGIYILAPEIISLLAGKTYLPAVTTIRILSPITLLMSLSTIFGIQVLNPIGKEKYLMYCVIIGMALSITSNLILIPIFQYNGTAITSVITEIVIVGLTYYYTKKFIGVSFSSKQVIGAFLSSTIFFPIYYLSKFVSSSDLLVILINLVFSTIGYFSLQYFIFKDEMAKYLLGIVLNQIKKR